MMSFWVKVDAVEAGFVRATTYDLRITGDPFNPIRTRTGATVSQALRSLAAAMVTAKAETISQSSTPEKKATV
jgi:hypothetical protein